MSRLQDKLARDEVYFIAEMSANHGNDLAQALKIVDAAASSGADCLKVQTYTADTLTLDCDNEYFTIKGGLWDGRRLYELYSDASLSWEWHESIKKRCEQCDMDFLSTPFDETAVDFLEDLGVTAYKIASFELIDLPLLEYVAAKKKPMIMSCGMATVSEISEAVEVVRGINDAEIILLKCCSEYPADPDDLNLSTILDMRERFGLKIGFSDHSMGFSADVVAASLGACLIEKHFCLGRSTKTADSEFSMTPDEYREMVKRVQEAKRSLGDVAYGASKGEESSLVFRRSVFATASIQKGEVFTKDNIKVVRPGYGAKPKYYKSLIGQVSNKDYKFGEPVEANEDIHE